VGDIAQDMSPTARALLALEVIQNNPGNGAAPLPETFAPPHDLDAQPGDGGRTHLLGTTDEPDWYARQIAAIPAPFRVIGSPELQHATAELGRRLKQAGGAR
jgi:hypothetical protein